MLYIMQILIIAIFQILEEILELATTTIKKFQRKNCDVSKGIIITFFLNFRKKCLKFLEKIFLKIKFCLQKMY